MESDLGPVSVTSPACVDCCLVPASSPDSNTGDVQIAVLVAACLPVNVVLGSGGFGERPWRVNQAEVSRIRGLQTGSGCAIWQLVVSEALVHSVLLHPV